MNKNAWEGCLSKVGKNTYKYNFLLRPKTKEENETTLNIAQNLQLQNNSVLSTLFNCWEKQLAEESTKLDIFSKKQIKKKTIKKNNKNKSVISKIPKLNFEKLKKVKQPDSSTSSLFNINYDKIKERRSSFPSWRNMSGRQEKKLENDQPFYMVHGDVLDNMAGHSYIEMSKRSTSKNSKTKRNDENNKNETLYKILKIKNKKYNLKKRPISGFSTARDTKNNSKKKNENKSFIPDSKENNNTTLEININDNNKENNFINQNNNNNNNNLITDESKKSSFTKDSYDLFKDIYLRQIKKKSLIDNSNNPYLHNNISQLSKTTYSYKSKQSNQKLKSRLYKSKSAKSIKAPDFNKIISREYVDKISSLSQRNDIPFYFPNYSQIHEKPKMMVIYNKKKHKIFSNKSDTIPRIDSSFYSDPNKNLHLINNHITAHAPDFNLMSARSNEKDPFPTYMHGMHDRFSCDVISAKSLKLNNYSNRQNCFNNYSSFWPQFSFNTVINLNLINSTQFKNFLNDDNEISRMFREVFPKSYRIMKKSKNFYDLNYENLLRNEMLTNFDNITYKHNKNFNNSSIK